VMARGNAPERIYWDDEDRQKIRGQDVLSHMRRRSVSG
jgi:hypothetical protein